VQAALPKILQPGYIPESFFEDLKAKLKLASEVGFERLSKIRGIKPVKPSAAMYMMVGIDMD
jgi:tyrosine aminotransferase